IAVSGVANAPSSADVARYEAGFNGRLSRHPAQPDTRRLLSTLTSSGQTTKARPHRNNAKAVAHPQQLPQTSIDVRLTTRQLLRRAKEVRRLKSARGMIVYVTHV